MTVTVGASRIGHSVTNLDVVVESASRPGAIWTTLRRRQELIRQADLRSRPGNARDQQRALRCAVVPQLRSCPCEHEIVPHDLVLNSIPTQAHEEVVALTRMAPEVFGVSSEEHLHVVLGRLRKNLQAFCPCATKYLASN